MKHTMLGGILAVCLSVLAAASPSPSLAGLSSGELQQLRHLLAAVSNRSSSTSGHCKPEDGPCSNDMASAMAIHSQGLLDILATVNDTEADHSSNRGSHQLQPPPLAQARVSKRGLVAVDGGATPRRLEASQYSPLAETLESLNFLAVSSEC